ncbi:Apoptotic chromatin condensation inducer in the nucleus-like isoform X2 [Oopsacas minuta]|uniref:Apoptotic chromatin condensation inducer in the nucleus-like isoform X2 n=1 Tax=Oopsacas minuta TaxID=111878 RepID=A0AAV7JKY8_9METZ|nr:Apoptotic chromatin condensation inducer in the nucleus-like isoform X2 [Oopsacas minuta]
MSIVDLQQEISTSTPIPTKQLDTNTESTETIPRGEILNSPITVSETGELHSTPIDTVESSVVSIIQEYTPPIPEPTPLVVQESVDKPAVTEPNNNVIEDSSQNMGNNSVVQEDRIEIFTSEQEFSYTDAANTKSKAGEDQLSSSFNSKENGNIEITIELSDKENTDKSISHRTSRKSDETLRDKKRGIAKHLEHHTHKDLREILTKNSFVANKHREVETRRIRKTPRSGGDKLSLLRDRESTQRHKRMYQEIKNTLTYSSSSVINQRDIDPAREWEDKKREREIQRIEVERARRELETRRRQDSQSSQQNPNNLKRSSTSYTQEASRPLTIEGGHSEYPIPPVVAPLPSDVPATRIARVQNLVRPFTQQQLKCMLELYGYLIVGTDTPHQYFWTDKNKTQCCCVYQDIESCEKARNALHGARWPSINPKNLHFSFLTIENYNELTGLGINQEILDNTFQVIVEKAITPPPKVKLKEKEKKEKPKEREREKERDFQKESRDILKKVKRSNNESSDKQITSSSTEKNSNLKKDQIALKLREHRQNLTKFGETPVSHSQTSIKSAKQLEIPAKLKEDKQKISQRKQKISQEKPKISEEKLKSKPEKPKIAEKKLTLKRLPPTPTSPLPPRPKKSKETPAVQSESDVESDNYQCSGQAALLDTLFRKTTSEPCIYWLPLTEKQVKAKLKRKQIEAEKLLESESRRTKRKYSRSPKRKRK